jgi:hypothetical protein
VVPKKAYVLSLSKSRISASNTSCAGGSGGALGASSSFRLSELIPLTAMKIANAIIMKSTTV